MGVVQGLAQVAECTVLVGSEHSDGIRRWSSTSQVSNLAYVEVIEPTWGRYSKRHRTTQFLLYLFIVRRVRHEALRLHRERPFDLTYHATPSAFWLPLM